MKPDGTRTKFLESFRYAFHGIVLAYQSGKNIRIQTSVAGFVVVAGIFLQVNYLEWALLVACIGAVVAAECLNTAIEHTVDVACSAFHPLAGAAKDLAAGGVLVLSIASSIIGCIIFIPKVLNLLL